MNLAFGKKLMQNKLLISLIVSVAIVALLFYSVPAAAFYMSGTPSVSHVSGSPDIDVTVALYKSDPLEMLTANNVTAALKYDPSGTGAYVTATNCSFGTMNYENAYGYGYDFYGYAYGYGSTRVEQFSGYDGYSYGYGNASGTNFSCTFHFNSTQTLGHTINGISVNISSYGLLNQSFYDAGAINRLTFASVDASNVTVNVTSFPTVNIANQNAVNLSGACKNGTSVTLNVTGGATVSASSDSNCSNNAWTVTAMNLSSLTDGTINATAYQTDSFGNTGSGSATATKDTVAPVVTVASFPVVNIANQASVTLSGACENGLAISLRISDGANPNVTATPSCALGAWTAAANNLSSLNDGTLVATAYQTDAVGNTGTGTNTSTKDTVAPTCDLLTLASLSARGYVNGTNLYYRGDEAGLNTFTVLVNSTGTGGAVANVTFPAIGSGFSNTSTLEVLSAPYNVSYAWGSATATGAQTAICYDSAGNSNTTSFTLTPASMPNVTLSLAEPDAFYSAASGNNIIHARVNVTSIAPLAAVTLNFSNITTLCGADPSVLNATYNATSGYWEGSCNVATKASTSDFVGGAFIVTTTDNVSFANVSTFGGIILYNMTTPPNSDPTGCTQFLTGTTDMSTELDFNSVNFAVVIGRNGNATCNGQTLWSGVRKVSNLTFAGLNMSSSQIGNKLAGLATAINVSIPTPHTYRGARIYVNETAFSEFNTGAAVALYSLPFTSIPAIIQDTGAAATGPAWTPGGFDATLNATIGNLTFSVSHFSGYNASDTIAPSAAIASPAAGYNSSSASVLVNVSANGTGSEISQLNVTITNSTGSVFNTTVYAFGGANTANCTQAASGSEAVNCQFTVTLPAELLYTINVSVNDFGSPANTNYTSSTFRVDLTAPNVSIQVPVANAVLANNSNTTLLNFTVASSGSGLNSSTCQYSLNGTRVAIASCANGTQLNFTSDGVKTLSVFAKDNAGNEGNTTISFLVNTAAGNKTMLNGTTTMAANGVIYATATSPAANITMSSSATNVSLNMTAYNSTTFNVSLPEINVNASTSLGNVIMNIPNGTVVSGASDWNGTLQLPMVKSNSLLSPTAVSGYTNTVTSAIEIGVADFAVNLSKAVRILIPGKANSLVGFQRSGVFTAITTSCANDSQAAGDALATGAECKINNGTDMVIWTKHFTMFGTYTQTANGGGSGGSSSNGGGSVFGGSSSPSSAKNTTTYNVDLGSGKLCAVAITRELVSGTNKSVVTTTLENTGGSDCNLQDFVFADTIPSSFPAINELSFNPAYTSQSGWEVSFGFPTFAGGESKTLTYTANTWVGSSKVKNFTVYTMSAKQQAAPQPSANATTPATEEPSVWIPHKLPPMPVEQPAAQPTAPAQPTPATGGLGMLGIVGIVAAIVIVGGIIYYFATHKKKGL